MGRYFTWALGATVALGLSTTSAAAQSRIDVGVWLPNVGARVVVGAPRVVVVAPPRYVVVQRDNRHDRGRRVRGWDRGRGPQVFRGQSRAEREYYQDVREAEREYYEDLRDARRDYERDVRRR